MIGPGYIALDNRGVLGITGKDANDFLQTLITNNMDHISFNEAIYAALLTPQGKFLYDFIIFKNPQGGFLLDCESDRLIELGKKLLSYKLRVDIEISDLRDEMAIYVLFEEKEKPNKLRSIFENKGILSIDPRDKKLGFRTLLPLHKSKEVIDSLELPKLQFKDYDVLRLKLGLPDGSRDIDIEKSTIADFKFELANGVDFSKGCYVGQEVTTRMKSRGKSRRQLIPVQVSGTIPPRGTLVFKNGKEVGEIKSGIDGFALALIRPDRLTNAGTGPLLAGNTSIALLEQNL